MHSTNQDFSQSDVREGHVTGNLLAENIAMCFLAIEVYTRLVPTRP